MASTLSRTQSDLSADLWPIKPSIDARLRPVDVTRERPSLGGRALRALARFLLMFCIGVAATLGWQSYGDAARENVASSYPQLAWLSPQPAPPAPAAPTIPAPDLEQLKAMSLGLAAVRQSVDQLAAGQQQMATDIAKLQADEQDILHKMTAAPLPRPAAAPARKPVPQTPVVSSQAPPAH